MVEVLIAMGAMAVIAVLSGSVFNIYNQQNKMASTGTAILEVRDDVAAIIRDDLSWDRTVAMASGAGEPFACYSGAGDCTAEAGVAVQFQPRLADGTLHRNVNSLLPNEGYDPSGDRCTTFSAVNPNPNCIIRFEYWRTIRCPTGPNTGGGCYKPAIEVEVRFDWSALEALQNLRRQKFVNLRYKDVGGVWGVSRIIAKRGEARPVNPSQCPADSVVTSIRPNGSLVCTNWNSL